MGEAEEAKLNRSSISSSVSSEEADVSDEMEESEVSVLTRGEAGAKGKVAGSSKLGRQ